MNAEEAARIAGAINALRPEWGHQGIYKLLAHENLRHRGYEAMTRVMVEVALDPRTQKPTRVLEQGPWWLAAGTRDKPAPQVRRALPTDCDVCGHPAERHVVDSLMDHEYRPRHASGRGVKAPTELLSTTPSPGIPAPAGHDRKDDA